MKIISYNVNGIRAAINKGFIEWLRESNIDVICIQETKANKEQVEINLLEKIGYHNYWFSAQKKGYSGVAIFSKKPPNNVIYGTKINHIDYEGRVIQVDYDELSIISLYLPSGTNIDRLEYKFKFMKDFKEYIDDLKIRYPKLIICGDYNICHKEIDIHDPIRNKNVSGFLPVEREWLQKFIDSGFIDSFREYNSNPHQYSWWTYRANARANNKGWRIDYIMVSSHLKNKLNDAEILNDIVHSDHCPITISLKN